MHTYGNNALVMMESEIVETLTAYSDREISTLVESAYNLGRRKERAKQCHIAKEKRIKHKQRLESIKLTIALGCGAIGFPMLMILHWIAMGY